MNYFIIQIQAASDKTVKGMVADWTTFQDALDALADGLGTDVSQIRCALRKAAVLAEHDQN